MAQINISFRARGVSYVAKLTDESDGERRTFDVALFVKGAAAPIALGMFDRMCLDFGETEVPSAVYERLHDEIEEIVRAAELAREGE